jgi:protein-tyrosine phosphatase
MALQYPISYLILAITCLGCSSIAFAKGRYVYPAVGVTWIGIAFLGLAVAYFLNRPGFLGKLSNGGRHPLAWLLLCPYLVVSAVSRSMSRGKLASAEIRPGLHMGRHLAADEATRLRQSANIKTVVDLAAEHTETLPFREAHYHSLPVLDAMPPTADQLAAAIRAIDAGLADGSVYLHCALGYGRSGTVAAAYLIHAGAAADVKQAIALLKQARPGVVLSRGQRDAVVDFARCRSRPAL